MFLNHRASICALEKRGEALTTPPQAQRPIQSTTNNFTWSYINAQNSRVPLHTEVPYGGLDPRQFETLSNFRASLFINRRRERFESIPPPGISWRIRRVVLQSLVRRVVELLKTRCLSWKTFCLFRASSLLLAVVGLESLFNINESFFCWTTFQFRIHGYLFSCL